MSEDTRVDLSALEPGSERTERVAALVAARAAAMLARRRAGAPVFWIEFGAWRRPVLAAAALLAALSLAVLVMPHDAARVRGGAYPTLAEAEGLPPAVSALVEGAAAPSGAALLGLREETR